MAIEVNIKADYDISSSSISTTGVIHHIITETDKGIFGITDSELKDAVEKYFGRKPNDVYLHSPTPWHDLYHSYGWLQVQTYLYPKSAVITELTSEQVTVAADTFINRGNSRNILSCGVSSVVSNKIKTNWQHQDTPCTEQKVRYIIELLGAGEGEDSVIYYESKWGQRVDEPKKTAVVVSSNIEVELNPEEAVRVELTASKHKMKVRIAYCACLDGDVAVNYEDKYKEHHFWGLWIADVMNAKGLPAIKEFIEEIEIEYYSNFKTEFRNPQSGDIRAVFAANDKAAV